MIKIRPETPNDYNAVFEVTLKAFEHAKHSDGDEQNLVNRLRNSNAFIPELSLVAEINGKIVGHIMFTKLKTGDTIQLALAPLSVLPEYQKQGIGGKLIKTGHKIAQKLGYEYSVLVGHPEYYPRFGYRNAADFGIAAPFDLPENVFMAFNLQGQNTLLNAEIEYPKEFFEK